MEAIGVQSCHLLFISQATDGRPNSKIASGILRITVETSGSTLEFTNEPYSFNVSEGANVGTVVFNNVRVRTSGLKGEVRYVLTGLIPGSSLFQVNPTSGKLVFYVSFT